MPRLSFFLCFLIIRCFYAQDVAKQKACLDQIRKLELDHVLCQMYSENEETLADLYVDYQYSYLKDGLVPALIIQKIEKQFYDPESPYYLLLQGDILTERGFQNDTTVYNLYVQAFEKSKKIHNKLLACESVRRINRYLFKNQNDVALFSQWAKIYAEISYDEFEKIYAGVFLVGSMMADKYYNKKDDVDPLSLALKLYNDAKEKKYPYLEARLSQLIGVNYDLFLKDIDKALWFYDHSLKLYQNSIYYFARRHINDLIFNIGTLEQERGNLKIALFYFNQIDQKRITSFDSRDLITINDYLYKNYKIQNKLDSALFYLERKFSINDSLDLINRANEISAIEGKYQNQKKEHENLQLRKNNRSLWFGALLFLIAGALIALLINKNTTKKRKLAEQQEQIQKQKVQTLLKEQELTSIDAMIEGQEKERVRVANELHDDLGSLMATVKLHFSNIKSDKDDTALQNASALLEQAYQKIRGIAHSKNSGVIANQGLVPAVQKMAQAITETSKIKLEVHDFGLEDRMENSLELTLFRIIQELVTNIIKHAEATEGSIQLTHHHDNLNIIVADNGKGFDMSAIARTQSGMGLGTIEKRIENLEGSFTVDSVLGKGTSVIIDIPI